MSEVQCATCRAPGTGPDAVRLDLDATATPSELVCKRCKCKPRCPACGKRRNRLQVEPGLGLRCGPCLRQLARDEERRWRRTCSVSKCRERTSVELVNEHGECPSCSIERLYREHPIARSPA